MAEIDGKAIRELSELMADRGVPYYTGRRISLTALPNTRQLVDWMKAHPNATIDEMRAKAKEIGEPIV